MQSNTLFNTTSRITLNHKELLKGTTETIILSALRQRPMHGYRLRQWMRENSEGALKCSPGMLYPLLHKLEKQKLIEAQWKQSQRGPRRKEYTLTAEGRNILIANISEWLKFISLIHRMIA